MSQDTQPVESEGDSVCGGLSCDSQNHLESKAGMFLQHIQPRTAEQSVTAISASAGRCLWEGGVGGSKWSSGHLHMKLKSANALD